MGKFKDNRERTISQKMFAHRLSGTLGITHEEAERIVQSVKQELISCIVDGLCVKMPGLGTIGTSKRKGCVRANNVFTGGSAVCKDTVAVNFRTSNRLKKLLNIYR